ncbi:MULTISPECIES: hypothetical protein [Actinomadura]|uniref:hypothetical protein n=1 Tax=Actinomadura TaxID=1988 RepID=UPI0003FA3AB6|nr:MULTISPECIES: hypothetical protein [Actinomadura]RSN66386.1 hypothetical protein DMH08_16360 [Actinomadura sp. WAC 06369]
MALGIEFANVVGRVAECDRAVPGGLDGFAEARHNYTEDAHLFRVGFMSTGEARALAAGLPGGAAAVVASDGPLPGWLRRGEVGGSRAVWLAGHAPGPVVPPLQGVLLQGPPGLRDALARDGAATVRRRASGGDGEYEVVRGGGLVDLDVIGVPGGACVYRAARRRERNRRCGPDIALLRWLDAALRDAGARG